jgi:raffinose/stachyose/melibiose transport system permease protein
MKRKITKSIILVLFILVSATFLYPFLWMILSSFKTTSEIIANPFNLPASINFDNYVEAVKVFPFATYYINSIIYTIATVFFTIIVASMLAYSFARLRWKLSTAFFAYVSIGLIIPIQVIIIPLFMILNTLGLRDTYWGLIVPYVASGLPFAVMLLYAFFRNLPFEMEQAACIDGCNVYTSFIWIIFPMTKPAILTLSVISFMKTWNEYYLAAVLVSTNKLRTVTIGLKQFFANLGTSQWGLITAIAFLASIPTLILYLTLMER